MRETTFSGTVGDMARYIRWRLILGLGLLIALAAGSPVWLEFAEPFAENDTEQVQVFECPSQISPEQCNLLSELDQESGGKAETFVNALLADPVPAPANEQNEDSLQAGIEVETFSEYTETRIRTGEFTEIDALRYATGQVNLWELVGDGEVTRILRFGTDFESALGVDLHVYLSVSANPTTPDVLLEDDLAYDAGLLKGNIGGQNYTLPPDLDITQFASVVIYSTSLEMIFSVAPLQQPIQ
jgi:Electron transfer DM13